MEIKLSLNLPLMAKARPRCGQGHAYLPANYREWKNQARDALAAQWVALDLPTLTGPHALEVDCYGPGRHDPDNLLGAVLDAGLPCKATGWRGCWRDDRVTVFPSVCIRWHKTQGKADQLWQIAICNAETAYMSQNAVKVQHLGELVQ